MDEGSDARRAHFGFKTRLFERMRGMHRAWIEQAREIRDLEQNYGSKLMAAKSPAHAASLCNEWMAKRMAIVAHEQEMFANSWLWLLADMSESPNVGTSQSRGTWPVGDRLIPSPAPPTE
jgi:hypothetical protein